MPACFRGCGRGSRRRGVHRRRRTTSARSPQWRSREMPRLAAPSTARRAGGGFGQPEGAASAAAAVDQHAAAPIAQSGRRQSGIVARAVPPPRLAAHSLRSSGRWRCHRPPMPPASSLSAEGARCRRSPPRSGSRAASSVPASYALHPGLRAPDCLGYRRARARRARGVSSRRSVRARQVLYSRRAGVLPNGWLRACPQSCAGDRASGACRAEWPPLWLQAHRQ
mmetsp:Transcript_87089/g.173964  ORF Transcript_87089/g.173964 Transcript_87089/m.173964 type:complete len:224 (-) Transcript_87089:978-1649(-)